MRKRSFVVAAVVAVAMPFRKDCSTSAVAAEVVV
jgi:hypothetical protein